MKLISKYLDWDQKRQLKKKLRIRTRAIRIQENVAMNLQR